MKLSTRCRYGLRALVQIGRGGHERQVKRREIVERQGISDSYLENILIALRLRGFISASRGAKGGYTLADSPAKIRLLEVIEALEGSLAPVSCVDDADVCQRSGLCAMRGVYRKFKEVQERFLAGVTLQDLIDRENSLVQAGPGRAARPDAAYSANS